MMKKSIQILILLLSPVFLMSQSILFDTAYVEEELHTPETHKDTITVKALCVNGGALRDTFQDSEKIVGAEVYLAVKKMERTLEKQWVGLKPMLGHIGYNDTDRYKIYKDVVIAYRYLDAVEGCYQLVLLESWDK